MTETIEIAEIQNLASVLVLPTEGWLKKTGGKKKGFKRRYFRLKKDNIIYYYKSEKAKEPAGTINLTEAQSVESDENTKFSLHIHTKYRVYVIVAENEDEHVKWLEAIERGIGAGKFASNTSQKRNQLARKQGWMTKRGGSFKSWKKRWFVLHGASLMYYKIENDKTPLGEIALKDVSIKMLTDGKHSYCIDHPDRRSYYLRCSDDKERKDWIDAIKESLTSTETESKKNVHLEYDSKLVHAFRKVSTFTLQTLQDKLPNWEAELLDFDCFKNYFSQLCQTSQETCKLLFDTLNHEEKGVSIEDFVIVMTTLSKAHPYEKIELIFTFISEKENISLSLDQLFNIFKLWNRLFGCWELKHLTFLHKMKKALNVDDIEEVVLTDTWVEPKEYFDILMDDLQFKEIFLIWDLKN
ncbi:sesquipedalian [Anaeramoeba flamelloides]|uniref:Sesquipedalian n=1 Tax=Anaeramoeba flamelloides TaxID=1746091 RepID=A0AAV8A4D1_9EUKA|nr:sesquipedalian [Anaeramoeba flamelloides]